MRILQIHNEYMSGRGGEDFVLEAEFELLHKHGHDVHQWIVSSAGLKNASPFKKLIALLGFIWSPGAYSKAKKIIKEINPDVIHVHNFFPLLSPSILWAAKTVGIPVVMTLHNYRLICPSAMLFRDNKPCELCIGRLPFAALRYRCKYADSFAITVFVFAMQSLHRVLKTFDKKVDAIIVLSEFARSIIARTYLPTAKLFVKPNFISGISSLDISENRKHQVVFIGRIQSQKGIDMLVDVWMQMDLLDCKLVIIGDGPDKIRLEELSGNSVNIEWRGSIPHNEIRSLLGESQFLVLPSRCYETFSLVVIEAFNAGTPVLVPDLCHFPKMVVEGKTGFLFRSGDKDALKSKLNLALSLSHEDWMLLSKSAYNQYLTHYTQEENYSQLMNIYESAISVSNNMKSR